MIRLTNEQGMTVLNALQAAGDPSLEPVTQLIQDQIARPSHEMDLVDTVAKVIGSRGRVRNVFTDDKLETLRSAIFSPRELMRLRDQVDQMHCAGCAIPLREEQLIGTVGEQIFCTRCMIPAYTVCGHGHLLDIQDSVSRLHRKAVKDCSACAQMRADEAQAAQSAAPPSPAAIATNPAITWNVFSASAEPNLPEPPPPRWESFPTFLDPLQGASTPRRINENFSPTREDNE